MNLKEEIKMQIAQLNMWTKAYDEGHPMVSDEEWDNHYFALQALENKSGIYLACSPTQNVQYQVKSELTKVKHNHPMLSLDKTKDKNTLLNYFAGIDPSKDVIAMLKMDGLTCSLRYVDGKLVSAETRGNGEIGEDILHNAMVIPSIPKKISIKEEIIIDGEIICTYDNFKPFSVEYKNPRNFAAGSIRLLDAKECAARDLTFVAWYVVKGLTNYLMNNFERLDKLGFTVVPWCSSFDWDAEEFLVNKAKELGYPIDGLVGRFNDREFSESLGATGHHAKAAYAYKFYDEEYETELIDIEWTMGRTGVLTPVAVFKPLDIDGTVIERASLHNVSVMKDLLGDPYVGQKVWVAKMNMIIPQIIRAEKGEKDD